MARTAPPEVTTVVFLTYIPSNAASAEEMDMVKVDPPQVNREKDMPILFKDRNGGKVRIVFLSPEGKETNHEVKDSEPCTLTDGGLYHFHCYFTRAGSNSEDPNPSGGVLDVVPPHKDNA